MKRFKLVIVFFALLTSSCDEVGDVLQALVVPNNAITNGGKTFNVTKARYSKHNGYCSGEAFFITAYTSSQEEIQVILSGYPDLNTSYQVFSPDGNCSRPTPFVRVHLSNGNVAFSDAGTCTLNDNASTFNISNVKLDDGSILNGKGSYTN